MEAWPIVYRQRKVVSVSFSLWVTLSNLMHATLTIASWHEFPTKPSPYLSQNRTRCCTYFRFIFNQAIVQEYQQQTWGQIQFIITILPCYEGISLVHQEATYEEANNVHRDGQRRDQVNCRIQQALWELAFSFCRIVSYLSTAVCFWVFYDDVDNNGQQCCKRVYCFHCFYRRCLHPSDHVSCHFLAIT